MTIRPVGAELVHADRHEDAKSHLSQFCESVKKMRAVDYLADYLQQS